MSHEYAERNSCGGARICSARRSSVRLVTSALPGEIDDLGDGELDRIIAFLVDSTSQRTPGTPQYLDQVPGTNAVGERRMMLAVVNDDMPFLVDSIAQTISTHGIDIHRLLHPVIAVRRDSDGVLNHILPQGSSGERHESIVYLELERVDARVRRQLESQLRTVLAGVRAAVRDWSRMQSALQDDADRLPDGEGAALLRWFLDRNFTQLGHHIEVRDGTCSAALGILAVDSAPLWSDDERKAAFAWFAKGRRSTADRQVPSHRDGTPPRSARPARRTAARGRRDHRPFGPCRTVDQCGVARAFDKVPVLRARLASIEQRYGFDPQGHAGKALHHALASLPHDLLIAFDTASLERLALEAMSLADRPRARLMLIPKRSIAPPLRLRLDAARRGIDRAPTHMIGDLLSRAADAPLDGWAIELGDGDLALIRFTFDLPLGAAIPDAEKLDRQIAAMLRGWPTAVETTLAELVPTTRATRLAIRYANSLPAISYRERMTRARRPTTSGACRCSPIPMPAPRPALPHRRR